MPWKAFLQNPDNQRNLFEFILKALPYVVPIINAVRIHRNTKAIRRQKRGTGNRHQS